MSLDFTIAATYQEAMYNRLDWSIDEKSHELIFHRSLDLHGRSQLLRMAEYHADVEYSVADLPTLLADLDVVSSTLDPRSPLREALQEFRKVCALAQLQGKGIFGFAD